MPIRILAVSSLLTRRLWYRTKMEHLGCEVQTASDRQTYLDRVSSFKPHVIILESSLTWSGVAGAIAVTRDHCNSDC